MGHKKRTIITALILVTFAYWCTSQGYDTNFFWRISPLLKHAINFSLLLFVAGVGYYALYKTAQPWVTVLWIYAYSIVILFIAVLGIIDLVTRFNSQNFRDFVGYLRAFFTSPVPLAVLLFINYNTRPGNSPAIKK